MLTKSKISEIKSLSTKRGRSELGLFVAEGVKTVVDIISAGMDVKEIYSCIDPDFKIPTGCIFESVTEKEMERISELKSSSSMIAIVRIPVCQYRSEDLKDRLSIVLDTVQDPGNMGTIIRIAAWFGIKDIFCSKDCADCFNPKVVQSTMGAIGSVNVHYVEIDKLLTDAQSFNVPIYGTFLEGDNIYTSDLSANGLIVMGNEGKGISDGVKHFINNKLYIPPYSMTGETGSESLNVAIATAITCSEFRRRIF